MTTLKTISKSVHFCNVFFAFLLLLYCYYLVQYMFLFFSLSLSHTTVSFSLTLSCSNMNMKWMCLLFVISHVANVRCSFQHYSDAIAYRRHGNAAWNTIRATNEITKWLKSEFQLSPIKDIIASAKKRSMGAIRLAL